MEVESDRCDRDTKALGPEKNSRESVDHPVPLPPPFSGVIAEHSPKR
jgi:hypothetical protein